MNPIMHSPLNDAADNQHLQQLNTVAVDNMQPSEKYGDIRDYYDGPILSEDNWTIQSIDHTMPLPSATGDIRDYYDGPILSEDNWTILSVDHAMPLSSATNYSGQFQPQQTTNYGSQFQQQQISLEDNWTILSVNHATPPPSATNYDDQFQPQQITNYGGQFQPQQISLEDNWTRLSVHHATPSYGGQFQQQQTTGQLQLQQEDWRQNMPLGVKFRPTDKELIVNYLQIQFILGEVQGGIIPFADIYDYRPDQLQALTFDHGDGKMYFFTNIKKIGKSKMDRSIKSKKGYYWRATQALKPVKDESGSIIGYKMHLTCMRNKFKTSWLMTEYRLHHSSSSKLQNSPEELVLAVVYRHEKKKVV